MVITCWHVEDADCRLAGTIAIELLLPYNVTDNPQYSS